MNARQMVKEIRTTLQAAAWASGAKEKVLGTSVYIRADLGDDQAPDSVPFALLEVGTSTPDADDASGLEEQDFVMVLAQAAEGDPQGQKTVIGGGRSVDEGSSQGRGLLELQTPLLAAAGKMTGADGAALTVRASGAATTARIDGNAVTTRAYTLSCWCHVAETYEAPQNLTAGDNADGTSALAWTAPSARHDFVEVMVRVAAGATAPASETAGTLVYSGKGTSFTHASGTGQKSYSIFAGYSNVEGTESQSYSSQVTGSTRTVTVT